jgi:hypothetical protein
VNIPKEKMRNSKSLLVHVHLSNTKIWRRWSQRLSQVAHLLLLWILLVQTIWIRKLQGNGRFCMRLKHLTLVTPGLCISFSTQRSGWA